MKKTLTVNLGGTVFHIDEDAYRLLDNYLSNLKSHFRKQKGAEEIVSDMETRISELFAEKLTAGLQVITIAHVEEVIGRMGKPEEMDESAAEEDGGHAPNFATGAAESTYGTESRRRLYRNPDDKILGGVASGMAAYFAWETRWMRVLFFVLLFLPYCPMFIAYIVLWIIIPEARTATEKLNMRGEDVTLENIGKTVTDGFERVANGVNDFMSSEKPKTFLQQFGDFLVEFMGFVLKAGLVVLAIVCSPVLFVLAIAFVALIIVSIMVAVGGGTVLYNMLPTVGWTPWLDSPMMALAGIISIVMVLGLPLVGLVYAIMRQLFNWASMSAALKWSLFILWVLALAACIVCASSLGIDYIIPLCGIH